MVGGYGAGDPPDPIPNSEVKTRCADGTAGATRWESTAPPTFFLTPTPVPAHAGTGVRASAPSRPRWPPGPRTAGLTRRTRRTRRTPRGFGLPPRVASAQTPTCHPERSEGSPAAGAGTPGDVSQRAGIASGTGGAYTPPINCLPETPPRRRPHPGPFRRPAPYR
jgi:hypothetical protein